MRFRSPRGATPPPPPSPPMLPSAASAAAAALHLTVAMAAVTLAFPGTTASARQDGAPAAPAAARQAAQPGPAGRHFLEMAARGNAAELEAGRLALERSRNEEVRRVAQTIVDGHTKAQARLAALAKENGIADLPDAPDPLHQELASRLREATGDEFDRMFIAAQVRDHLSAISLYEHAANLARDPQVSAFALGVLPELRRHAEEVVRVAEGMKVRVAALEVASLRGGGSGALGSTPFRGVDAPRTGPGAPPQGAPPTPGAGIPLDALRSAPAGYLNRQMTGTVRIGERLGERVFYVVPTTGAAAAGTGAGTTGTDTGGVLAVLDESFTGENTPRLVAGQIVEIVGVVRDPSAAGANAVPTTDLSQNLRERLRREPVVLVLRRVGLRPAAGPGAGTTDPGRPGP